MNWHLYANSSPNRQEQGLKRYKNESSGKIIPLRPHLESVRRGICLLSKRLEQLTTSQGFYPSFRGPDFPDCAPVLVAEAWPAGLEVAELPSRLVAEDAELLLVVRGPLVARAWAALWALLAPLEARLAQDKAAGSDARVEPVRAFAEPKAAQSAESRAVDPGHLAVAV
jgi:hypothetical protein